MVKPGYKQTEIGVIPEDWEVKPLKVIAPLQRGFDLPYSQMEEGKYPVVFSNGIGAYHKEYKAKGPGVITGRSGTIGKVHYVSENYWPHNTSLWVTDFRGNDEKYIYYLFQTIHWELYNSGSGVPTLNRNDVHDSLYSIPPLPEQKRIAEALSDMDELISSLEKLVEKKKALKQGAMQELLTGKRRLQGFSGEWAKILFGDLFEICPNNAYSRDQLAVGGKIKNIHYGDILTKYGAILDGSADSIPTLEKALEKKKHSEKAFVQDGDIIIADTAEDLTVGKAVEIINVSGKLLSGQHTFLCRPVIQFAPMYLGYYLNSAVFHDQVVPFVTGTKVSSINKSSLCSLTVRYPDIPEQKAIAEILFDMDNNISALELRLTKACQMKQGMMQQLLTGMTRIR